MTTFLLVRHAAHDWLGRGIAGRLPEAELNDVGHAQAAALPLRLLHWKPQAVISSPQPRTLQTAAPVAKALGLQVQVDPAFDEIDFGEWTGRSFEQLRAQGEAWECWVHARSRATPPGGEAFAAVHARAVAGLCRLMNAHPDGTVVVVSHGDVLKALVAEVLGLSLDHLERIDIGPASVSVVAMGEDWAQLRLLNALG